MKHLFRLVIWCMCLTVFTGCLNYRKLITDEVVLKDENSFTGTILKCDSSTIKLKQADESIKIISWNEVDTIQGKKLKTLVLGTNIGYYKVPYFSVFRNESFAAENLGFQLKAGLAYRGTKIFYVHLSNVSGKPYPVTKFGFGFQRYLINSTYLFRNSFFTGGEVNLMNVPYNNGPQLTLEPFTGYERKINDHLRIHFKLGMQFNLGNKNNNAGVNTTIGIHFMKRNFSRYYQTLNKEHRLPKK